MKRLFVLLFALTGMNFACPPAAISQYQKIPFVSWKPAGQELDDGNYEATVYYQASTGHTAKYRLVVSVSSDCVTSINFGNGGSVHAGYNSEGYVYSGGALSFSKDYAGNLTSASTVVRVVYPNGSYQQFTIQL